jgi:hypothetical protein
MVPIFHKERSIVEINANGSVLDTNWRQSGWTLDVLNIVRRISEVGTAGSAVRAPSGRNVPAALPPGTPQRGVPANSFATAGAYAFERELEVLAAGHPPPRGIWVKHPIVIQAPKRV